MSLTLSVTGPSAQEYHKILATYQDAMSATSDPKIDTKAGEDMVKILSHLPEKAQATNNYFVKIKPEAEKVDQCKTVAVDVPHKNFAGPWDDLDGEHTSCVTQSIDVGKRVQKDVKDFLEIANDFLNKKLSAQEIKAKIGAYDKAHGNESVKATQKMSERYVQLKNSVANWRDDFRGYYNALKSPKQQALEYDIRKQYYDLEGELENSKDVPEWQKRVEEIKREIVPLKVKYDAIVELHKGLEAMYHVLPSIDKDVDSMGSLLSDFAVAWAKIWHDIVFTLDTLQQEVESDVSITLKVTVKDAYKCYSALNDGLTIFIRDISRYPNIPVHGQV